MSDIERRQALANLMAMPDSPDLRRGHRKTLEGRPERYDLVPQLAAVFIQRKLLEFHERDASRDHALWRSEQGDDR